MGIHFSHVLETVWMFALREIFKKPIWMNVYVFPYFCLPMEIHFSHVLGTVWISASRKICKKPLTLECSFPYLEYVFPYLFCNMGIHSSHRLRIVWISASHEICKKPIPLEYFCFPIIFPYYKEFNFPMFWKLYRFLLHVKYIRNPWLWNVLFSYTFVALLEFTFPMFLGQYYWCEN